MSNGAPSAGGVGPRSSHLNDDVCLDLLLGLLPESEIPPVLAHLDRCAACQSLLKERAAEYERVRAEHGTPPPFPSAATQASVAKEPRSMVTVRRGAVAGIAGIRELLTRIWRNPPLRYVTAGVVVILVVLLWPGGGDRAELTLHRLRPVRWNIQRSAEQERAGVIALQGAVNTYSAGNMREAIGVLDSLRVPASYEMIRRVFLGSALAFEGKDSAAASVLKHVDSSPPEPLLSEERWTLYVALRRSHQEAPAESLLVLLRNSSDEVRKRALRELERRSGR
jgi:hypothetical protein